MTMAQGSVSAASLVGIKQITVRAKIIRADGTIEDKGVVAAYYAQSWWKRQLARINNLIRI